MFNHMLLRHEIKSSFEFILTPGKDITTSSASMKKIAVILSALTSLAACAGKQEAAPAAQPQPATQTQAQANLPPGLYAVFHTAKGDITAKLYEDKAPKTVKNFTELAEGKKEWTDPRTGQKKTDRFYDGLTFMLGPVIIIICGSESLIIVLFGTKAPAASSFSTTG